MEIYPSGIYLKCVASHTVSDSEGHPEYKLKKGTIYKASYLTLHGTYYNQNTSALWSTHYFKELSKVEVFVELKGRMDLVEELP
jgi:hypothetical protein